ADLRRADEAGYRHRSAPAAECWAGGIRPLAGRPSTGHRGGADSDRRESAADGPHPAGSARGRLGSGWCWKGPAMSVARYLIFGAVAARIRPAFRLAMGWEGEHGVRSDGLLQVGDLGYFPDIARLDKATARHAAADPLELGACLVVVPNRQADEVF